MDAREREKAEPEFGAVVYDKVSTSEFSGDLRSHEFEDGFARHPQQPTRVHPIPKDPVQAHSALPTGEC